MIKITLQFNKKLLHKSKIIIVIEDETGNIFGSYIDATISNVDEYIDDEKAFLFSLESKGSHDKMMKFDIIKGESKNSFKLF